MRFRLVTAAVALVLTAAALSGCTGEPDPAEPTPAFSSEEEAFAAAEETYRAYVDALNRVDLSDPETFEDVFAWTTGEANAEARETFSQMHADGWMVGGQSRAVVVKPMLDVPDWATEVQFAVCLDVSTVTLVDDQNQSVVDESRPEIQSMLVTLSATPANSTGWAIADFDGREGEPACE